MDTNFILLVREGNVSNAQYRAYEVEPMSGIDKGAKFEVLSDPHQPPHITTTVYMQEIFRWADMTWKL